MFERLFERVNVARDDRRIEPQVVRAEEQLGLAEIATQRVARLLQKVAAVRCVALRPQVNDELVPTDAFLAGRGEQRQERKRLAARGGAAARGAVLLD